MLSRVHKCNEKLSELNGGLNDGAGYSEIYDWRNDYILIGSDVKSLFPSLSPRKSGKAVRRQFEKSPILWQNVDLKLLSLYLKLNEKFWTEGELDPVRKFLPS